MIVVIDKIRDRHSGPSEEETFPCEALPKDRQLQCCSVKITKLLLSNELLSLIKEALDNMENQDSQLHLRPLKS